MCTNYSNADDRPGDYVVTFSVLIEAARDAKDAIDRARDLMARDAEDFETEATYDGPNRQAV